MERNWNTFQKKPLFETALLVLIDFFFFLPGKALCISSGIGSIT